MIMEEKFESTTEAPDTVNEVQLKLEIRGAWEELRPLIVIEEIETELMLANDMKG